MADPAGSAPACAHPDCSRPAEYTVHRDSRSTATGVELVRVCRDHLAWAGVATAVRGTVRRRQGDLFGGVS